MNMVMNEELYLEYIKKELSKNRLIKEKDILLDIDKYNLNEEKLVNLLIDNDLLPPIQEEEDINSEKEFLSNLYK